MGREPESGEGSAKEVPTSEEQSIKQAVAALNACVETAAGLRPGRLRKGKKAQASASGKGRVLVEVPCLDESPAGTVQLVAGIVAGLVGEGELTELTVLFADFESAKAALKADFPSGVEVEYLEESADQKLRGNIMVVRPGGDEVEDVVQLMSGWSGRLAVLLNPGWDPFSPPPRWDALLSSFETVYSFLPVTLQVFGPFGALEGAVLKRDGASPWQIFLLDGDDSFIAIGQQKLRPSIENLETALANAVAKVGNPIISGLSGLFGKKS